MADSTSICGTSGAGAVAPPTPPGAEAEPWSIRLQTCGHSELTLISHPTRPRRAPKGPARPRPGQHQVATWALRRVLARARARARAAVASPGRATVSAPLAPRALAAIDMHPFLHLLLFSLRGAGRDEDAAASTVWGAAPLAATAAPETRHDAGAVSSTQGRYLHVEAAGVRGSVVRAPTSWRLLLAAAANSRAENKLTGCAPAPPRRAPAVRTRGSFDATCSLPASMWGRRVGDGEVASKRARCARAASRNSDELRKMLVRTWRCATLWTRRRAVPDACAAAADAAHQVRGCRAADAPAC
eukprot:scaffold4993_cov211-Prasinococcus_capsulatus_cf.AAC.1